MTFFTPLAHCSISVYEERPEIVEGENMEPNKAGEAFLRLMQEEWRSSWTGKPLTTDVNGLGYAMV